MDKANDNGSDDYSNYEEEFVDEQNVDSQVNSHQDNNKSKRELIEESSSSA